MGQIQTSLAIGVIVLLAFSIINFLRFVPEGTWTERDDRLSRKELPQRKELSQIRWEWCLHYLLETWFQKLLREGAVIDQLETISPLVSTFDEFENSWQCLCSHRHLHRQYCSPVVVIIFCYCQSLCQSHCQFHCHCHYHYHCYFSVISLLLS